ncbi:MAG: competence/damage-inducible protein A [Chloroflexi bacterium]|nr:MAG: competence/damage-inducible protein A [Chloroflexota bacterium]
MPRRDAAPRPIVAAELLSIGSELTTGETRDTNTGELARSLSTRGVTVLRIQALPDDLEVVTGAFAAALERADVVVSTGGLGPTPDDLTREAIAAVSGATPAIDAELEAWLRSLWDRRGMPFAEINLKQAWLIPAATAIPNPNGTAPGWWVDQPDGRVVVALPGPPREMRPMWADWVLPRLDARGTGRDQEVRTLRLTGIGESQVADRLGESLLRAPNPTVATYARSDAVDVRIAARPDGGNGSGRPRSAADVADAAEAAVIAAVGEYVWARGDTTWRAAIGERLDELGWRAAAVETGLGGELTALFGDADWLERTESRRDADAADAAAGSPSTLLEEAAERARREAGTQVGIAVRATERGADMAVTVAVATPVRTHTERRLAFLGGAQGRSRAALTAAAVLLAELRRENGEPPARPPQPSAEHLEVRR